MEQFDKYYKTTIMLVEAKRFGKDVQVKGPDGKIVDYKANDYMVRIPGTNSWEPIKRVVFEKEYSKVVDLEFKLVEDIPEVIEDTNQENE